MPSDPEEKWNIILETSGLGDRLQADGKVISYPGYSGAQAALKNLLRKYGITEETVLKTGGQKYWDIMLTQDKSARAFGEKLKRLISAKLKELNAVEEGKLTRLYTMLEIDREEAKAAGYDKIYMDDPCKPNELVRLFIKNAEITETQLARYLNKNFGIKISVDAAIGRLRSKDKKISDKYLFSYAAAIAEAFEAGVKEGWLDPRSKKPLEVETILHNKLGEKGLDEVWRKTRQRFTEGMVRDAEALLYCIDKSGVPRMAIGPMIGSGCDWLRFRISDNHPQGRSSLYPSDVAHIADRIKPYLEKEKNWIIGRTILEVENPQWLENHQTVRAYVIEGLKKRLGPEREREIEVALATLPDECGDNPALAQTLGPTLKRLREEARLSQKDFREDQEETVSIRSISNVQLSRLEHNYFNPNCVKEDGTLDTQLQRQLDHFVKVVAEHWLRRGQTPGTQVDNATARKTGRGAGRARDGS